MIFYKPMDLKISSKQDIIKIAEYNKVKNIEVEQTVVSLDLIITEGKDKWITRFIHNIDINMGTGIKITVHDFRSEITNQACIYYTGD